MRLRPRRGRGVTRTVTWTLVGLAGAAAVGCGSEPPCEVWAARAGLVGGSPTEGYLGLDPTQARSILEITGTVDGTARRCSGVLVDRRHLLSAAHCDLLFRAPDGRVHLGDSRVAAASVRHPTLDLLLATLDSDAPAGIAPIAIMDADLGPRLVGTVAVMAGTGDDRRGGAFALSFAAATVSQVGPADVVLSGDGDRGGCDGDSGGPLLIRGDAGDVRVAGTLTSSSLSCRDTSRFVRVDVARAWLISEGVSIAAGPCGTLGTRGGCFEDRAIWCDGAALRVQACAAGSCGWSQTERGFRCIDPSADPCAGVDARGHCEGEQAVRCNDGQLQAQGCLGCGLACGRDPATYAARCR